MHWRTIFGIHEKKIGYVRRGYPTLAQLRSMKRSSLAFKPTFSVESNDSYSFKIKVYDISAFRNIEDTYFSLFLSENYP